MAASMSGVILVLGMWAFPLINNYKSAKAFCAPVRELAEADAEFRLYSVGFSREEYVFYTQRFIEARFTGLVGETPTDFGALMDAAKLQKQARKLVVKAAERASETPFAVGAHVNHPEEQADIREAIEAAVAQDVIANAMSAA